MNPPQRRFATLAATVVAAFVSSLTSASPLRLEQYLEWTQVSAPQISPDGKTIVYTRSRVNAQEDRIDAALYIMDSDGSRNRYFADGTQAVWSPDGKRVAFTRQTSTGPEIFVRWLDSTEAATQITHAGLKPTDLVWSPDGRSIAFRGMVPSSPSLSIDMPAKPAGARWTADATVIDSLHYRMDRSGVRPGYKHLFVVAAEGGVPRQLTHGRWHVGANMAGLDYGNPLQWTADGNSIVFSGDREDDHEKHFRRSALHVIEVESGSIRQITSTPGFWGGLFTGLRVSPDGRNVAYIGHQESKVNFPQRELRVAGIDRQHERTLVADLPGYVYNIFWAPDGPGVYYLVEKHGSRNVHYVSLDGRTRQVTDGQQVLTLTSVSNNGIAVGTRTSPTEPEDLVRFNLRDGGQMKRLTEVNADVLRGVELGAIKEIWYPSSEDARIQGWIIHPPGFDSTRKYPLLMFIHGGPETMIDVGFSFRLQDMAASGYLVLFVNPRGSTGYGAAFASAIDNAFPGRRDLDDLMNGLDAAIDLGYVDTERLYVMGGSAGGTLATWMVAHTDRFAAAVSLNAAINWISFAGTTDVTGWANDRFQPDFWQDPGPWLHHSPMMHVPKISTPTLVMTGEHDLRTPVSQTDELYTALKIHDVPTKLVIVKDEHHGTVSRPSNLLRTQLYLRKWFSSWRRKEGPDGPSWIAVEEEMTANEAR